MLPRGRNNPPVDPREQLAKAAQLLDDGEQYLQSDSRVAGARAGVAMGRIYLAQVSASLDATDTPVDPRTNEPPAVERNERGGVDTGALLAQFRNLAGEAGTCADDSARRRELLADAVQVAKQLDRALGAGAPLPQAWAEMQRTRD